MFWKSIAPSTLDFGRFARTWTRSTKQREKKQHFDMLSYVMLSYQISYVILSDPLCYLMRFRKVGQKDISLILTLILFNGFGKGTKFHSSLR